MMENLVGELIIVNPDIIVDPANQQGKVGKIMAADPKRNHYDISFGNDYTVQYSGDELLILKSKEDVHQQVLDGVQTLKKEDYKTLFRISMFQDNGTPEYIAKAYDLLAQNHSAVFLATTSVRDRIDLSIDTDQDMEIGPSPMDNPESMLTVNPFTYNYMNKVVVTPEKLPLEEMEKYGLAENGRILIDSRDVQALLEGRRSDVIKIFNLTSDDKTINEVEVKISLTTGEDGKVELKFHPMYKEAVYPDFLTDTEAEKLQNGETVNITKKIVEDGLPKEVLVEFDEVNNEFVTTDVKKIVAPDMMNAEYLNEQQREEFKAGNDVELSDGTKFRYTGLDRLGIKADKVALIASILIDGGISYILYSGIKALTRGGSQGSERDAYTAGYLKAMEFYKMQEAGRQLNNVKLNDTPALAHGYTRQGISR